MAGSDGDRVLRVKVPAGFNPKDPKHMTALQGKVGGQWRPLAFDKVNQSMTFLPTNHALMHLDGDQIPLDPGTRTSDGDRIAKSVTETRPGYHMITFEPHLGYATIGKLTADELRCREAVANALGVKPWEVLCQSRPKGGFTLRLPGKYSPGRMDDALKNVAENVMGRFGWYVKTNPKTLQCDIIPSDPPTFPATVEFPFDLAQPVKRFDSEGDAEWFTLELAEGLGGDGKPNHPVQMPLDDSIGVLVVGQPGSGKSVAVQSITYQVLVKGYWLAVLDTPAKRGDFAWAKPYVHDNWWGCSDSGASVAEALTVATLVDEEGKRRGDLNDQYGVTKWQDLPAKVKRENPPILVVADELAALLAKPNVPAGLPKEAKSLPEFIQMAQVYMESKLLTAKLNSIVAVHRAVGIRVLYLSQRPSKTEGFPPELKSLIPHRVLLGTTSSESDNQMAFRDHRRIPAVPVNIRSDTSAARGAGVAHLDGFDPVIIKGFFATNQDFELNLRTHLGGGDPRDARVRPTAEQIARCVPRIDDIDGSDDNYDEDEASVTVAGLDQEWTPSGKSSAQIAKETGIGPVAPTYGADGKRLSGAAAAASASKREQTAVQCPHCGKSIATCTC